MLTDTLRTSTPMLTNADKRKGANRPIMEIKGLARSRKLQARRNRLVVDNGGVRRIQMALIERQAAKRKREQEKYFNV